MSTIRCARLYAAVFLLAMLAAACGPRAPFTASGWSAWYRQGGGGEMGSFDTQRKQCLEQSGAAADPTAVRPDSSQEDQYLTCMNAAGWCTDTFHCEKP